MGLFMRKNHLLRCWGWLSLLNWIGSLTLFLLLKLSPRKLEPWFVLWSVFLLRLLWISINLPYHHACLGMHIHTHHVWAHAPSCYLQLLDKLPKWIYMTVGPSLVASLELLAHPWNVVSLSVFNRFYLGRCSSELAQ